MQHYVDFLKADLEDAVRRLDGDPERGDGLRK
jgi:hypothetical protein